MIKKWTLTYPAYTGDEPRRAYVYLPEGYKENPGRRYPVLYMFDGHNVFFDEDATYGKCWGMSEYLDAHEVPLIVAACECNHSPDGGRLSEYSPFTYKMRNMGMIKGRGEETMAWLIHTFKPWIDASYRTLPDRAHTFIMGSSMGGLMSVYALFQHNDVFSRAAALSPAVGFSPDKVLKLIREAEISEDAVLYMDCGEHEFAFYPNARKDYERVSKAILERGVKLTSRIIPNGTHCEASWEKQLPFCIPTLLYEVNNE